MLLLALGVFAEISAWIVEPSKALLDAAYDGILPARFEETNKNIVCFIVLMAVPLIIYSNRHRWSSNGKATGDEK